MKTFREKILELGKDSLPNEPTLEAVKQNGLVLQDVHNQTEEMCLEAVKQDGHALQLSLIHI